VLGSCAAAPPPAPPAPSPLGRERVAELARRWAADWEAFSGLRAAVELRVRTRRSNERVAALLLLAPTALRVEVATPFGLPAFVGTAGPDGIALFHALERRAQTASATPEAVARWLGIPVPPGVLIRLLAGSVPLPPDPSSITLAETPEPHLAWVVDGIRYRVWPTAEGRPGRVALGVGTADRLTAELDWSLGGALAALRVEAPERGAELVLRYLSAEPTVPPPDAFRLTLPADIPVRRLD
jgi:hypothetical protein